MSPRIYLRWIVRETRGARGRVLYFVACLAIGVAAVVGTASLSASIQRGFDARSREMLGADFTVDARRPLPEELDRALDGVAGLRRSHVFETATMVTVPELPEGRSRLGLLKVVEGDYPLYGEIVTRPPGGLSQHLGPGTVVAAAQLLETLRLEPGDELSLGGERFRIAAAVVAEPPRMGFSSFLGPHVYLTRAGFERTELLGFGSRVQYRALYALPGMPAPEEIEALTHRLKAEVPGATWLDFDHHFEEGLGGSQSAQRIEGFVGLVALLSLVMGGIGVSQIVGAWLSGRTREVAVMRCLGLRPAEILLFVLGHTLLLALVGSLVGAGLGVSLPWAVRILLPQLLPGDAVAFVPIAAVVRGVGLGLGLALTFALPPLTAIWRVSPARVLRADAEPLPPNRAVASSARFALLAGVFLAAWVQARDPISALGFTGIMVALVLVLLLGARGLIAVARALPRRRLPPYLVHGIAALARPGAGTVGSVVALGLGTMVVTATWLIETRLEAGLLAQIPPDAPSVFLVDIQPDQWVGIRDELERAGAKAIDQVPVVMARITSVDGRPVEDLAIEAGDAARSRRSLTREQRLTWRAELPPDNEITAGALWQDPALPELSVEEDFAERLDIHLGSIVTFDVQGVPITLHVTSLRAVQWQSFSINFFWIVEPGVLERAPALYLANAHVPASAEQALSDRVAHGFPSVSLLRIRPMLAQALGLLGQMAAGLRLLGSFTMLAGLAILAGAVSATSLRRGHEVALLKTLGVTRVGVVGLLATEYSLTGLVAGTMGAAGAFLLAFGYLEYVAAVSVPLPYIALPVAALGCASLTAICGLAASAHALSVRPIEALRGQGA